MINVWLIVVEYVRNPPPAGYHYTGAAPDASSRPGRTPRPSCTYQTASYYVSAGTYTFYRQLHWGVEEVGGRDDSSRPEHHPLVHKYPPREHQVCSHDCVPEGFEAYIVVVLAGLV